MTREMGSRGKEVAQRLAQQMGLTLILHELVEHDLAEHMHVPESAVHHRLEGGATLHERWQIGSKRLAHYTAEEILDRAQKGNVLIRGWGACVLLRGVPHIARVRVCAPMEAREPRVMERLDLKDFPRVSNPIIVGTNGKVEEFVDGACGMPLPVSAGIKKFRPDTVIVLASRPLLKHLPWCEQWLWPAIAKMLLRRMPQALRNCAAAMNSAAAAEAERLSRLKRIGWCRITPNGAELPIQPWTTEPFLLR